MMPYPSSRLLLILSVFLLAHPSQGQFFEYEHLSDAEQMELNAPRLIDTEYQSDKLAFDLPLHWNHGFLSQQRVFQYGAGSLGPTRFLTRGRFKIRETLSEHFFFQLSWLEMGDFERDRRNLIFEFGYKILPTWSLHIYGQPATLKREDDLGLAMEWSPSPQQRLRLFHTWVDFSHNKRNEASDRYQDEPSSWGFVWRSWREGSEAGVYQEIGYRQDTQTRREDLATGEVYQFSGHHGRWSQRLAFGEADFLQWEIQASQGQEGSVRLADGPVTRWQAERVEALVQWDRPASWLSMVGIKQVHIDWLSDQGPVRHNSLLPHVWLRLHQSETLRSWNHQIHLGLESTWHRGRGEAVLRSINDADQRIEGRANLRYRVFAQAKSEFTLLLSFDLDSMSTAPWEGGSMQYSLFF